MNASANAAELEQLVQQLSWPNTRRHARQRLVAIKAVGTLVECLASTNESVVWAAVESLGELRAPEAIEPLVKLLDRGILVTNVCEALTRITGKDFGADVKRWRQSAAALVQGERPKLDVAECVKRAGEYVGVEPNGSGDSYAFRVTLPGARTQKVAVYFGREDSKGEELVVIYSECGPADPKYYETLLRKNITIPAGAFAVRDVLGKPHVVMVDTMMAASVTPSVLAKKIENIASRADTVEKAIAGEDRR